MENLYHDTRNLDKIAINEYGLTEDIMMENAAEALEKSVFEAILQKKMHTICYPIPILIVCGGGNNGGDGYTLARRLAGNKDLKILLWIAKQPKSPQCILQAERAKKNNAIQAFTQLDIATYNFDAHTSHLLIVDCFIGSGFTGTIRAPSDAIIKQINILHDDGAYTIACDVPSGLPADCSYSNVVVCADKTVTMGALKTSLYCECAKEFAGKIECANLGIQSTVFENSDFEAQLVELNDTQLPHRNNPNTHKGSFGHVAIFAGEKPGAAIIAGTAAFSFGTGLTTLVLKPTDSSDFHGIPNCPFTLMQSQSVPTNVTAVCAGPGLGRNFEEKKSFINQFAIWFSKHTNTPCVLDADMCYYPQLKDLLHDCSLAQTVITPHPKEFASILHLCNLATEEECSIPFIKNHSIKLVQRFCKAFPRITLILKGSTQIIGYYEPQINNAKQEDENQRVQIYLNPWGNPCLAKGGTGDVLAGLIAALLAQNYSALEAAICASLALTLAAKQGLDTGIIKSDYSMSPFDLIDAVKELK
ncbi:MAG: NAD(P)H-hydrate epimerase [Treponema sp. CETP13]|nr:MAG: NAD(P)H-hydrate epimerase [Treponema sp. CETP13]